LIKVTPFLHSVSLLSPGGSVEEAIKIGRLIRRAFIYTRTADDWRTAAGLGKVVLLGAKGKICEGPGCYCASFCFLIWAAGVRRSGDTLGVHRPTAADFGDMAPGQATALYRDSLREIANYLEEMEIKRRYIDFMTDTSSRDIKWLTSEDRSELSDVPSFEEWLASACGMMSKSEKITWANLALDRSEKALSPRNRKLYDDLSSKQDAIDNCTLRKVLNARDAIINVLN
jgi:hypothetical protein